MNVCVGLGLFLSGYTVLGQVLSDLYVLFLLVCLSELLVYFPIWLLFFFTTKMIDVYVYIYFLQR